MPEREARGIKDCHEVVAVGYWLHGHKIGQMRRMELIYIRNFAHQSQNAMFLYYFAILRFEFYAILLQKRRIMLRTRRGIDEQL